MTIKITLFITLALYAFIAQPKFFYMLGLSKATKKKQAIVYLEIKNLLMQNCV